MKTKISFILLTLLSAVFFVQCTKDDTNQNQTEGKINLKITDAPSDDANIQATFVTVSDVKVDGQSVNGFTKQTIKISDLQSGKTEALFTGNVNANAYSKISLVLDYDSDASGNSPGCYVLDTNNAKHDLSSSASATGEITLNKSFSVQANGTTNLVVDFDLRKSIVRDASGYKFVTNAELQNALRVENADECGTIKGKANNNLNNAEVIVYAYHKGDFNASTETRGQGTSNVLFARAVTSAKVGTDGSYQLSFLKAGDYEIHIASYTKDSSTGKLTFNAMANANSTISGMMLNSISVQASSNVDLNFDILSLMN